MLNRCSKCDQKKDIKQFRMDRRHKKLSAWCKDCEAKYGVDIRSDAYKYDAIRRIRKSWERIAKDMSDKEVDQQLFALKEILFAAEGEMKVCQKNGDCLEEHYIYAIESNRAIKVLCVGMNAGTPQM